MLNDRIDSLRKAVGKERRSRRFHINRRVALPAPGNADVADLP